MRKNLLFAKAKTKVQFSCGLFLDLVENPEDRFIH